jgi:hypothetical protein
MSQILTIFATKYNAYTMLNSTDDHIIKRIRDFRKQRLFFTDDFVDIANYKAVSKALERLAAKGTLIRVAKGIYARYKVDTLLGEILPATEQVAEAIAKRDHARIVPTGAYALNVLGLSTQVPMNIVYLTDGTARKIKTGKRSIQFKKTNPRNLAFKGKISSLVIQALKAIGKDKINESERLKILELLKEERPEHLKNDIKLAPEWIRKIMKDVLN